MGFKLAAGLAYGLHEQANYDMREKRDCSGRERWLLRSLNVRYAPATGIYCADAVQRDHGEALEPATGSGGRSRH